MPRQTTIESTALNSSVLLVVVSALCSCSLLFESSSASDAGPRIDAPKVDLDASAFECGPSTELQAGGLGLIHAEAFDLNGDGRDEVLLIGESGDAPRVYVSDGRCALKPRWEFQQNWQPQANDEPLRLRAAALSEEGEGDRLVGLGLDSAGVASFAAFSVSNGIVAEVASIVEDIPQSGGSQCTDAALDFSIVTGNFDLQGSERNDIVFADANQSWLYLIGSWAFANMWDALCTGGNVTSSVPAQLGDSGPRLGIAQIPAIAAGLDEYLDIAPGTFDWHYQGGVDEVVWGEDTVQDIAVGRVNAADGHIDFVGWTYDDPAKFIGTTLALEGPSRKVSTILHNVDLDGAIPTHVALLAYQAEDYYLVVTGISMRLVNSSGGGLEGSQQLSFAPGVMVAANWGDGGSDQVYFFDAENGQYSCFEIGDGPTMPIIVSCNPPE